MLNRETIETKLSALPIPSGEKRRRFLVHGERVGVVIHSGNTLV